MEKIIKWAILAAILYAGFVYGRPYIQDLIDGASVSGGGASGESSDAGACIRQIERARDSFAKAMAKASPPVAIESWNSSFAMSSGRLNQARDRCGCTGDACDAARDAIDALDDLMSEWDGAIQSDGTPPLNGARDIERIDDLLEKARRG